MTRFGFRLAAVSVIAVVVGMASGLGDPFIASAQAAPDPQLELPLYNGFVGIKTASIDRPVVRVFDPSGTLNIELEAPGRRPVDGHWVVELREEGAAAAVMVRPGQRIEVELDAGVTSVEVPELVALTDADLDTVSGTVPAGSPGVYLVVHRDGDWLDGPASEAGATYPVQPDGSFSVDLSGVVDLSPGLWGEVAALEPGGHVVLSSFAVPAVKLQLSYDPQFHFHFAVVRLDPTLAPVLSIRAVSGLELLEVDAALRMGGPQFAFVLAEAGDLENGAFSPEPGQRIVLEADGKLLLEEYIVPASASIDRDARKVTGIAPAGSRVVVTLNPTGESGSQTHGATVFAGPEDRYVAPFPAAAPGPDAVAEALIYPGGALLQAEAGRSLEQTALLYGNRVSGVLPGRGELMLEHKSPGGELISWRVIEVDPAGAFSAELLTTEGDQVAFAPGDLIRLIPSYGPDTELLVPALTAAVHDGRRVLRGQAPPEAPVEAVVYSQPSDFYDPIPYERESSRIAGRSGSDGAYEIRCLAIDCQMHYGVLTSTVGAARYSLQWQEVPRVGVGATLSQVVGDATAGSAYEVTPFDEAGRPGEVTRGLVPASLTSGLPRFAVDLRDRFPSGMMAGDRILVSAGGVSYDVTVPPFTWRADVADDSVSGTAPALSYVVVIALNHVDASRPGAAAAQARADTSGRWQVSFRDFNLRPGDYLELYVPREGHFIRWVEEGIEGVEPTEAPTASPTRGLTAVPPPTGEATEVPPPAGEASIYLPRADT